MDPLYRGLAAPLRILPVGREDLDPAERPGAALVGIAREAQATGAFPPAPPEELPPVHAAHERAYDDEEDPDGPSPDEADMDIADFDEGHEA